MDCVPLAQWDPNGGQVFVTKEGAFEDVISVNLCVFLLHPVRVRAFLFYNNLRVWVEQATVVSACQLSILICIFLSSIMTL